MRTSGAERTYTRRQTKRLPAFGLLALMAGAGCGDRDPQWSLGTAATTTFALTDAIAVSDPQANRVLVLTTDAERRLYSRVVKTQRGSRTVMVAPDRTKLFVVSQGDGDARPPEGEPVQGAALEIVTRADPLKRYPLSEPFAGLALDPRGEWAVVYADANSGGLVRNPNELVLVNLKQEAAVGQNPLPVTLRSFGGRPQRFTFSDELNLPGGRGRLLIVETEQDVAIVDLRHPSLDEITIQLTSGQDTRRLQPAGVVVTEGAPDAVDDARIGIRLANDSTILMAQLVPDTARDFRPELNLTDVGGVPGDAAFVRTDGGALKLAVLVPSRSKAVLIDPATSLTVDVPLPAPYTRLSLVTDQASATTGATTPAGVDVALLWNAASGFSGNGGVSFWELGRTAGQPYRSVETVGVTSGVTAVVDVAGAHPELKILGTNAASFFLLNLRSRTSSPFLTSGNVIVTPSALGTRAWAHQPGTTQLSVIDLVSLHPERMQLDRAATAVFEIAAVEGTPPKSGARSLVVWHEAGSLGATVYDADATGTTGDLDARRNYSSILSNTLPSK